MSPALEWGRADNVLAALGNAMMMQVIVRRANWPQPTLRNIKQNLFLAFAYDAAGIPIAAGVLYALTRTLPSPMIAAAAMSLSSVSVSANALRLRKVDL